MEDTTVTKAATDRHASAPAGRDIHGGAPTDEVSGLESSLEGWKL